MMQTDFIPSRSLTGHTLCLLSVLTWTALGASSAAAETGDHAAHGHADHSVHAEHDHAAHAGHGSGDDPHAHHRAILQQTGYQRSVHPYQLDGALELIDMNGHETTLQQELNGDRPVLVNFIFTTCAAICPVMSATFAQVQTKLGPAADVRMISISIDPEHDTPERLRAYAQRFGAGPQWQFYTGELADIVAIQKALKVYRGNKANHEPTTLMRKSAGNPWVRLDGIVSAADIVAEYTRLPGR